MKAFILGLFLAIATLTAAPADAADDRNVTVVNGTGYGIKFLGFNNPGDSDWSDNEIGEVMTDGASQYVKFNNADKGCKWNIRISWAQDGYPDVIWHDIDLCSINKITLRYDRGNDTTSIETE